MIFYSKNKEQYLTLLKHSEKYLNNFVKNHWVNLFPHLDLIKQEFHLKGTVRSTNDQSGRIDILAFNPKTKRFVIVELKAKYDRNVFSQANDYKHFVVENIDKICLNILEEKLYDGIVSNRLDKSNIEVYVISEKFPDNLKGKLKSLESDLITLIRYKWVNDNINEIFCFEYITNRQNLYSPKMKMANKVKKNELIDHVNEIITPFRKKLNNQDLLEEVEKAEEFIQNLKWDLRKEVDRKKKEEFSIAKAILEDLIKNHEKNNPLKLSREKVLDRLIKINAVHFFTGNEKGEQYFLKFVNYLSTHGKVDIEKVDKNDKLDILTCEVKGFKFYFTAWIECSHTGSKRSQKQCLQIYTDIKYLTEDRIEDTFLQKEENDSFWYYFFVDNEIRYDWELIEGYGLKNIDYNGINVSSETELFKLLVLLHEFFATF